MTVEQQKLVADYLAIFKSPMVILLKFHGARVRAGLANGLAYEDITQMGMLGLVKAARNYDPSRGVTFASFASFYISQPLRTYLQSLSYQKRKVPDGVLIFSIGLGDGFTNEPTANHERPIDYSEPIRKSLKVLDKRYRKLIVLRYGLADGIKRNLYEVGTILGVTRQRVSQMEKAAFKKLAKVLRDDPDVRDFLEERAVAA